MEHVKHARASAAHCARTVIGEKDVPNYKYEPHPYDNWPMAKDFENPRPEEEIADDLTIHEKMYKIATAKYNPFSVGGSESIHDFE